MLGAPPAHKVNLFGIATLMYSFFTTMTTYLAIQLLLPVSDANLPVLLKTPTVVSALMIPNILLVLMFLNALGFIVAATFARVGETLFTKALMLALCLPLMAVTWPHFGLGFSFALNGGLFSMSPVMSESKLRASTPAEVERWVVAKATATVAKHGYPMHTLSASTAAIDDLGYAQSLAGASASRPRKHESPFPGKPRKRTRPGKTARSKAAVHDAIVIGAAHQ